jgi:hypothetical protein
MLGIGSNAFDGANVDNASAPSLTKLGQHGLRKE